MRFYLIDRIRKLDVGKSAEGVKCWTLSEEYFSEHFPSFPVVPGVLLTESMAQTLGFLLERSHNAQFNTGEGKENGVFAILSIIQKAKFKGFVRPGDQTIIHASVKSLDTVSGVGKVAMTVDGKKRAEAELMFSLLPHEAAGESLEDLKAHRDRFHRMIYSPGDIKGA